MSGQMENQLTTEQVAGFAVFYEDDFKPLVWLLIRAGASREEAQDVAQEAMHVALRSWTTIQSPKAFVRTVAVRTLYRGWKAADRENNTWQRIAQDASEAAFDASEDAEKAVRMLKELPDAQRLAFALHVDGYEYADIAEITGQNRDTVRSHVRHARRKLTRMLDTESTRKESPDGS